jgi:hypothetical protein
MSFEEAVEIVKDFGGGRLLEGLELVTDELDRAREDEDHILEITREERMAYFIVVERMRPLFA